MLKIEENNLVDWYFRVYIKEDLNDISKCEAYIIGAIPGVDFIKHFNIKKMIQNNKSESAIYLSVPLSNGVSIKEFKSKNIPQLNFKNHLIKAELKDGNNLILSKKIKLN